MLRLASICLVLMLAQPLRADYRIDSLKVLVERAESNSKVDLLNQISDLYLNQNTEKALEYAREALALARVLNDPGRLATTLLNVGTILRNIGETEQALQLFKDAQRITEERQLHPLRADVYHKIGVTYLFVNEFDDALDYANRELEIWEQLEDQAGLSKALNFKGLININLKKYDEALLQLEQSVQLARALNDDELLYKPLVNLGDLYMETSQPERALEYISESIAISQSLNNKFGLAVGFLNMGSTYTRLGRYEQAEAELRKALDMSESLNSLSLVRNCYRQMALCFEYARNFESALTYNKLYISTEDSMLSEVTRRKVSEMEIKYDLERKEFEINELREEQAYQQFRIFSSSGIALLLLSLLVIVVSRNRLKKKTSGQASSLEEKDQLLLQNQQMLQTSITYACQAQQSLVPVKAGFLNIFSDFFTLSLPQEGVGGDFYWFTFKGDQIIVVVGDAPGTGLPGALNAMLCSSLVSQVVNENAYQTPAEVLKKLHDRISSLNTETEGHMLQQGVEMAVFFINIDTRRVVYAGAGIMLYLFYQQHLQVIPADQAKIGLAGGAKNRQFNNKTVSLSKKDRLLLFTNGFVDQKGKNDEAFGEVRLRDLLVDLGAASLAEQKQSLENALNQWKQSRAQNDDILIFGLEI